jgi:flagellar biosynthesis/type III secretory pathway chaperone
MQSTISPQAIRGILQEQCDIAHKLLQTLTQEFAALSGNDLPSLETTLAAKQQFMNQLERLSQDFLATARLHPTGKKDDIAICLQHKDPQGAWGLVPLWRQLDSLLSQCRNKNNTNGKIISLNYRHAQQALEILRHGVQGSQQACYSPTGASQSPVTSRILGKV